MKTINDITKEQAIELCKLTWGFSDSVVSEYEFYSFDGDYGAFKNVEDAIVSVGFDYKKQDDTIMHIIFHIYPDLNCSIGEFTYIPYKSKQPNGKT